LLDVGLTTAVVSAQRHLPFVSVVIPAFNEEKTIARVVSQTAIVLKLYGLSFEIIVVDDGSKDETYREACRCEVLVLSNERNRGKGYCLRKGLEKAKGEVVLMMDSDGEHRPIDVIRLLRPIIKGADVVAGSRFMNGDSKFSSGTHRFGNFLLNLAIMLLTGRHITDSQTGFRALRRKVIDELSLESEGFEIETEITVKSLRNGFVFAEVPVEVQMREYGLTRIKLAADGLKIFRAILKSSFVPL